MTVQQLADELNIDEKLVRVWLRDVFPEQAPGKGGRWVLDRRMAGYIRRRDAARRTV